MANIDGIEYVKSSQIAQMTPATLRAFDKAFDKGNVVIVKDLAGETLEDAIARTTK